MTELLISVRSPAEAAIALAGGADLIDLKEPADGALGRLPDAIIAATLAEVAGRRPVSATIGDVPLQPGPVREAAAQLAALGVDIVKIGCFPGDAAATFAALAPLADAGTKLVAVLFADAAPDFALIEGCADAQFFGVMLDTADKRSGPLPRHCDRNVLARFTAAARKHGLFVGLAGSLGLADIPGLLPLAPDYLGFRSAATADRRDGPLDAQKLARLRAALQPIVASNKPTAAAGAQSAAASATSLSAGTISAKLR
jgi:uncharacterized protein (UPF0264 family)